MLGADLITRFDPPGLAFFRLGEVRLLLDAAVPSALLYLRVDDVRTAVERLRAAGVEVDTEPHQIFVDEDGIFGEAGVAEGMVLIRDSEGNLVGLASRQAASRQQVERLARQGGTPGSSRAKLPENSRIRASVEQLKVDLSVDEGHGVTTDPDGALLVGVDPWSTLAP